MTDISIIIPVYNAELYIKDSIESVLNQTFRNFELIIVNDGSTDSSYSIISDFDDKRIKLIQQTNKGQSAACNAGLKVASGEFIKFFDADDLLHASHLEKQLEFVKISSRHLVSCSWDFFVQDSLSVNFTQRPTYKSYSNSLDWFYDTMTICDGMMGVWLWLIPKGIIETVGGWNEELTLNNDFDYSSRLIAASNQIVFSAEAKLYYRKGVEGSLSSHKNCKSAKSAILTTIGAMNAILDRENSVRMRSIFANRFKGWVYYFYPNCTETLNIAERYVLSLGGATLKPKGGVIFNLLSSMLGWKAVRKLQTLVYSMGWGSVLKVKKNIRLKKYK